MSSAEEVGYIAATVTSGVNTNIVEVDMPNNSVGIVRIALTAKLTGVNETYRASLQYAVSCSTSGVVTAANIQNLVNESFTLNPTFAASVATANAFILTVNRGANVLAVDFQATSYSTIHTYTN